MNFRSFFAFLFVIVAPVCFAQSVSQRAYAFHENGQYDSAVFILEKQIENEGATFNTSYALAVSYWYKKEKKEALEWASNAIELSEFKSDSAFLLRGRIYSDFGQLKKADEDYSTTLVLNPRNGKVSFYKGYYEIQNGYFEEGKTALYEYLQVEKTNPKPYYLLGLAYEKLDDIDSAIYNYKEVIRLTDEDPSRCKDSCRIFAFTNLGRLTREKGDYQLSACYYEEASRCTSSPSCSLLLELGVAYYESGKYKLAIDTLKYVYQGCFENNFDLNNRVMLYQAKSYEKSEEYFIAWFFYDELFYKSVGKECNQYAYLSARASFLSSQTTGTDYSIKDFERGIKHNKKNAELHLYLAIAQKEEGGAENSAAACESLTKAFELGLKDEKLLQMANELKKTNCQ